MSSSAHSASLTLSLAGLVVLNTRPAGQQAELSRAIEKAGGRAVSLPLLGIQPLQDETSLARIREQIARLGEFDLLIFVSPNAAEIGMQHLRQQWQHLPAGLTLVGVGPATGAVLQGSLQEQEKDGPRLLVAAGGMGSESALRLPALAPAQVKGQRVAIVRGRGGREALADSLVQRGAQVDYIEVYVRQPLTYPPSDIAQLLAGEGVNAVLITSAGALDCFIPHKEAASLIPLVVPSARVQALAQKAGFQQVVDAGGGDRQSLLAALSSLAATDKPK